MEQLKQMKSTLMATVQAQMGNLTHVDTKELGEAIDMIKDLSEAIYYCTITEAMNEKEPKHEAAYFYDGRYPGEPYYRDMDRNIGRMYYDGNYGNSSGRGSGSGNSEGSSSNSGSSRGYDEMMYPRYMEKDWPVEMRDKREGRSPMSRRSYMESKEMHHDQAKKMQELEKYMQELSKDITEMIEDASPEEKQLLKSKVATLATKIS